MAETDSSVLRRSVPFPGGSCNARIGEGAIELLGSSLTAVMGNPQRALLAVEDGAPEELVELCRRQLTSAGFEVQLEQLSADASQQSFAQASHLLAALEVAQITADDVLVALGHAQALSLALLCSGLWCTGTSCAIVPLDAAAAISCVVTPSALALEGQGSPLIGPVGHPRVLVCDTTWLDAPDAEASAYARALMVATAAGEGEKGVVALAERASDVFEGNPETLALQIADTLRARGRFACATAISMRQSLAYGRLFAQALGRLAPELCLSTCLAEALRFSSRLALGVSDTADTDFVFTQDALLDRLGLYEAAFEVSAEELIHTLKEEAFRSSNRFMLALPVKPGRIRLSSVDDELLQEHVEAFCESRRRNFQQRRANQE